MADGHVNRRVIVLDADAGRFTRMWGAWGNRPDDAASREPQYEDLGRSGSISSTRAEVPAVVVRVDSVHPALNRCGCSH
ncbi:MAG: hypothetical protein U0Q12_11310 [Vicinamibacterales bacterium]